MKPIIGVSTAWSGETWEDDNISDDFFFIGSSYIKAIYNSDAVPILLAPIISNLSKKYLVEQMIDSIDGLLLSGGGDVGINSSSNHKGKMYLREQQKFRYEFEALLIKEAWKKDIPVLGICRGHQMIVEVLGGTITENPINGHTMKNGDKGCLMHNIKLIPSSKLAEISGIKSCEVNSYHTQVVEKMPDCLDISAISDDGVIEAVEARNKRFFMGVQFHPELLMPEDEIVVGIFKKFIDCAKILKSMDKF